MRLPWCSACTTSTNRCASLRPHVYLPSLRSDWGTLNFTLNELSEEFFQCHAQPAAGHFAFNAFEPQHFFDAFRIVRIVALDVVDQPYLQHGKQFRCDILSPAAARAWNSATRLTNISCTRLCAFRKG